MLDDVGLGHMIGIAPVRRIPRYLFPIALLLALVPPLIELALWDQEPLSHFGRELIVVLSNIAIVAGLAYYALVRIGRDSAAMAKLTTALDSAAVILLSPDGRITHWSKGCERLYGWSAAEARGQNKYAMLRSRCSLSRTGRDVRGDDAATELIETRNDGRDISVIERQYQLDEAGVPSGFVLSITDISQRVAAAEALRSSEERLAAAVAAHELGFFQWDVATGRIDWSPGAEQRLGLVPGMMTDFESWRAQVEPEDVQAILESIARAVATRADRFAWRYRFRQSQGGPRAVEGSSRAYYDQDGNLIRTVGIIMDVTEREEREAALRRREAQLRSVLETVPDAMIVIDPQGTILQFSAAAEALWGYRSADIIGQSAMALVPEEEREAYQAILRHFVETGEGLIGEVLTGTAETADGRRFAIEARTGVAQADGQMLLTMFMRDLSEELAAEERMSQLSAEIAHVSRQSAMSELAADLAHELNQPLSATSNFLAAARMLLERGESAERVTELLNLGSEQTQRAGEIIRRMRAFMARGEVEMRAESVERTVRDAVDLVLVGTGQFHIRVVYQLDPDARFIFADRIQVQQVLVNLIRNAMEILRNSDNTDRTITISSTKLSGQMMEIAVADNGPGIPSDQLKYLFSRFTTTKGEKGGMGIGLSISKRIIEAHGGTLTAENRPEGGACFRCTLPGIAEGEEA